MTINTPTMRIYQCYYKDEHISSLDNEFYPFDNRANPVVNLHEYYLFKQLQKKSLEDNVDLWGFFSWKWKSKLRNFEAWQVVSSVQNNPGYDVYLFNPFPELVHVYNMWEQGEIHHPGIIDLASKILDIMEIDTSVLCKPTSRNTVIASNYIAATREFWDNYIQFLDKFAVAITMLSPEDTAKLHSCAGYSDTDLNYIGFICERLLSTYLILHETQLKILPVIVIDNELVRKKEQAIQEKNQWLLTDWYYNYAYNKPEYVLPWIKNAF